MIFPGSSRSDPMSLPPTVPKVKFKIEFSCISLMIIKVVHPQSKNLKKAMSPIWLVSSTSPPLYPHPYSFFLGGEREFISHLLWRHGNRGVLSTRPHGIATATGQAGFPGAEGQFATQCSVLKGKEA